LVQPLRTRSASRSSLRKRLSTLGMKTLLSASNTSSTVFSLEEASVRGEAPATPSNSLIVQFPSSRWNLHRLESTLAYGRRVLDLSISTSERAAKFRFRNADCSPNDGNRQVLYTMKKKQFWKRRRFIVKKKRKRKRERES